jgi:hypothetical protein
MCCICVVKGVRFFFFFFFFFFNFVVCGFWTEMVSPPVATVLVKLHTKEDDDRDLPPNAVVIRAITGLAKSYRGDTVRRSIDWISADQVRVTFTRLRTAEMAVRDYGAGKTDATLAGLPDDIFVSIEYAPATAVVQVRNLDERYTLALKEQFLPMLLEAAKLDSTNVQSMRLQRDGKTVHVAFDCTQSAVRVVAQLQQTKLAPGGPMYLDFLEPAAANADPSDDAAAAAHDRARPRSSGYTRRDDVQHTTTDSAIGSALASGHSKRPRGVAASYSSSGDDEAAPRRRRPRRSRGSSDSSDSRSQSGSTTPRTSGDGRTRRFRGDSSGDANNNKIYNNINNSNNNTNSNNNSNSNGNGNSNNSRRRSPRPLLANATGDLRHRLPQRTGGYGGHDAHGGGGGGGGSDVERSRFSAAHRRRRDERSESPDHRQRAAKSRSGSRGRSSPPVDRNDEAAARPAADDAFGRMVSRALESKIDAGIERAMGARLDAAIARAMGSGLDAAVERVVGSRLDAAIKQMHDGLDARFEARMAAIERALIAPAPPRH